MACKAGDALKPWVIETVEPANMRKFAVILEDPNPIHLDPAAVRAAGLGDRVINQGPASFGYVLNMLAASFDDVELVDLKVRLAANVFGGDRVAAGGQVEHVEEIDGRLRLLCNVWLDVENGPRALTGSAVLIVPA